MSSKSLPILSPTNSAGERWSPPVLGSFPKLMPYAIACERLEVQILMRAREYARHLAVDFVDHILEKEVERLTKRRVEETNQRLDAGALMPGRKRTKESARKRAERVVVIRAEVKKELARRRAGRVKELVDDLTPQIAKVIREDIRHDDGEDMT